MSIIPWLNYPGRPIKKKPYKMPYSPPYKGSPYEYINLPNPGNLPQAVWENIMKDFDQSFRVSYKEITSAKIVADETEFEQQPGAVGLAITLDPREYTGKSLKKVVWDDIAKRWFQSVISWSDLDVITEQQFIWRPLLRGDNGGKLGALLKPKKSEEPIEPNVPVRKVYEGMDKERFTQAWKSGPEGKWVDIDTKTPYEKLSTAIEECRGETALVGGGWRGVHGCRR